MDETFILIHSQRPSTLKFICLIPLNCNLIHKSIPFSSPTFDAADLWVPSVALGAEADGLVVVDEALGVGPAVAGVHAVAVEAGLGLATIVICGAANNNNSCNEKCENICCKLGKNSTQKMTLSKI